MQCELNHFFKSYNNSEEVLQILVTDSVLQNSFQNLRKIASTIDSFIASKDGIHDFINWCGLEIANE